MSLGFHDLKVVTVADGEVALRIPRRWDLWSHAEEREGYWGCYEKGDADTGTLWIQVDHFLLSSEDGLPPSESVTRAVIEETVRDVRAQLPPPLTERLSDVDRGRLWYHVYDVEEDGEPLRFWFYRFFLARSAHSAIISINLVLTHAQMDEPEYVRLRAIIDREVRDAFLDPFRHDEWKDAERALGPLERLNFNNEAKLLLPAAMPCVPDDAGDETVNQWYCRLEAARSHAGLFVLTDAYPVAAEGDRNVRRVLADDGETAAATTPGSPLQLVGARRTPWGAVLHEVIDGTPGEPLLDADETPLRNHLWTYVCRDGNRHRRLRLMLMIARTDVDRPPYPALVAYLDRAVWRATFPGAA